MIVTGYAVPFLIGVTLDVGNGSCIKEEVSERKNIDGTRFDPGDSAIAVRWLERVDDDEQQRTFEFSSTDGSQFVINSTELRHNGFELDKIAPLGPIPRRSARSSTQVSSRARACGTKQYPTSICIACPNRAIYLGDMYCWLIVITNEISTCIVRLTTMKYTHVSLSFTKGIM